MQRYGQKHQKMLKNGGFRQFVTPQDFFFKNRALSLLYPYGALTLCKKLEKSLGTGQKVPPGGGWRKLGGATKKG